MRKSMGREMPATFYAVVGLDAAEEPDAAADQTGKLFLSQPGFLAVEGDPQSKHPVLLTVFFHFAHAPFPFIVACDKKRVLLLNTFDLRCDK